MPGPGLLLRFRPVVNGRLGPGMVLTGSRRMVTPLAGTWYRAGPERTDEDFGHKKLGASWRPPAELKVVIPQKLEATVVISPEAVNPPSTSIN